MSIQAIQSGSHDAWVNIEPYIIPAALGVGGAIVVSQVWGAVAAACFLGATAGVAVAFPAIVSQSTKDDVLLGVMQLVMMVALPFLGPVGVVGAISLAVAAQFTQQVRFFDTRLQLSQFQEDLEYLKRNGTQRAASRDEIHQNYQQLRQEAEAFWNSVQADGSANAKVGDLMAQLQAYKTLLHALLERFQPLEREQELSSLFDEIRKLIHK